MKFKVHRRRFEIIPESLYDIAFIEDTLGLKKDGDYIKLKRRNGKIDEREMVCIETDCEGVFNDD